MSNSKSSNILIAEKVLQTIVGWGVQDIVVCAGARNAPFIFVLEKSQGLNIFPFFEERSAGFFALGLAQKKNRPVAVITTSGTAVTELMSVAVEATYSQTPLIFITADRPRSYRGTGAPQSIDQVGVYFKYVETCLDIESFEDKFEYDFWSQRSPIQMNVCLKEPLIDQEVPAIDFSRFAREIKLPPPFQPQRKFTQNEPLIIAGPMGPQEAAFMAPILEKWGAPIYAEALSNLRKFPELQKLFLLSGDGFVRQLFIRGYCKSVIRLGGVPTLRFWRDLEEQFASLPVVALTNIEYSGLSRPSQILLGLENYGNLRIEWTQDFREKIISEDRQRFSDLEAIVTRNQNSEVSLLRKISEKIKGFIYLGNSLPIREWDLLANYSHHHQRFAGNRGANGIDGQVSAFLGGSEPDQENWGVFGDLTALYDLSSLALKPLIQDRWLRIVVINNSGGMIFKEMFPSQRLFLNQHSIDFSSWAKMFGFSYLKVTSIEEVDQLKFDQLPHHLIMEVVPSPDESSAFWQQLRDLK